MAIVLSMPLRPSEDRSRKRTLQIRVGACTNPSPHPPAAEEHLALNPPVTDRLNRLEDSARRFNDIDASNASEDSNISHSYAAEVTTSAVGSLDASRALLQERIPESLLAAADTAPQHPSYAIGATDPMLEQEGLFYQFFHDISPISDESSNEEAQAAAAAAAQKEEEECRWKELQASFLTFKKCKEYWDAMRDTYGNDYVNFARKGNRLFLATPSTDASAADTLGHGPSNKPLNDITVGEAEDNKDEDSANDAVTSPTLPIDYKPDVTPIPRNPPAVMYAHAPSGILVYPSAIIEHLREGAAPTSAIFATDPGLQKYRASTLLQGSVQEPTENTPSDRDVPLAASLRCSAANNTRAAPSLPARKRGRPRKQVPPRKAATAQKTTAHSVELPRKTADPLPPPPAPRTASEHTHKQASAGHASGEDKDAGHGAPTSGHVACQNASAGPSRKRSRSPDAEGGAHPGEHKRAHVTPSPVVYPGPTMLLSQTERVACPLGCGVMLAADTEAGSMIKHLGNAHKPLTAPPRTRALLCPYPGCKSKYEPQTREEWRTRTFARHLVQDHIGIVSYECPAEGCSYTNKRSDEVNKHIKGKCYVNGVGIAEAV